MGRRSPRSDAAHRSLSADTVSAMSARGALPHVDPRASRGPVSRAYVCFLGTRVAAWLSMKVVWKVDPHLMRLTGGRIGMGLMVPTALLETTGARSGRATQQRRHLLQRRGARDDRRLQARCPGAPRLVPQRARDPDVVLGGRPFRAEVIEDEAERTGCGGSPTRLPAVRDLPRARGPDGAHDPDIPADAALAVHATDVAEPPRGVRHACVERPESACDDRRPMIEIESGPLAASLVRMPRTRR